MRPAAEPTATKILRRRSSTASGLGGFGGWGGWAPFVARAPSAREGLILRSHGLPHEPLERAERRVDPTVPSLPSHSGVIQAGRALPGDPGATADPESSIRSRPDEALPSRPGYGERLQPRRNVAGRICRNRLRGFVAAAGGAGVCVGNTDSWLRVRPRIRRLSPPTERGGARDGAAPPRRNISGRSEGTDCASGRSERADRMARRTSPAPAAGRMDCGLRGRVPAGPCACRAEAVHGLRPSLPSASTRFIRISG